MSNHFRRATRLSGAVFFVLTAWAGPSPAATFGYGPGGLPDLSAYPIGQARFDSMSGGLGTPVSLSTDGHNQVSDAIWWIPAQGYAAPTAASTAQRATQAASSGFFSRLRGQAVGAVSGMVPGVGGVVAGQAANAVAATASMPLGEAGAIPGWWCRATFSAPGSTLASISCAPHAYTPLR